MITNQFLDYVTVKACNIRLIVYIQQMQNVSTILLCLHLGLCRGKQLLNRVKLLNRVFTAKKK